MELAAAVPEEKEIRSFEVGYAQVDLFDAYESDWIVYGSQSHCTYFILFFNQFCKNKRATKS